MNCAGDHTLRVDPITGRQMMYSRLPHGAVLWFCPDDIQAMLRYDKPVSLDIWLTNFKAALTLYDANDIATLWARTGGETPSPAPDTTKGGPG